MQSILAGMGLSIAAMGFAAIGLLSPIAGALLQEAIDVIVILNALRALLGDTPGQSAGANTALGERYQEEHLRLLPGLKRIRHIADRLDQMPPQDVRAELAKLQQFLIWDVIPHEQAEEATVYPAVAKLIGGDDPTAPMNRAHIEIAHMVSVLGRHLDELPSEGPAIDDIRDLKRVLYGLDAILRLHFAQEDEAYLALMDAQTVSR